MRKTAIGLILTLLLLGSVTSAKDLSGAFSLGYFNSDAPVGVRFWLNEKVGVDFGIGFETKTVYTYNQVSREFDKEVAMSRWTDIGIPYVIYPTERANFFVRPGLLIGMLDDRINGFGAADETWWVFTGTLTPGVEVFFGDNFSLEAGHGFALQITKIPDSEAIPSDTRRGETEVEIRTFDASVTYLGFHFYFR